MKPGEIIPETGLLILNEGRDATSMMASMALARFVSRNDVLPDEVALPDANRFRRFDVRCVGYGEHRM